MAGVGRWLWAALFLASACAAGRRERPELGRAPVDDRRYVDVAQRFEVHRPEGQWVLVARADLAAEGMATPVLLRNERTGTQVVIQLAPTAATPNQLAERLTEDLRRQEGFTSTDPEPLALADGAVGFDFALGTRLAGQVAVLEAGQGEVFMLLATWPLQVPGARDGIDEIFRSVRRLPAG